MSELISADACRKYAEICRYRHSRLVDIGESNMFQALERVCLQAAGAVGWEADAKREMGNAGSLRARLAEADALLREARETIYALAEQQAMPDNWYCPALDRIDAHLSRKADSAEGDQR